MAAAVSVAIGHLIVASLYEDVKLEIVFVLLEAQRRNHGWDLTLLLCCGQPTTEAKSILLQLRAKPLVPSAGQLA